MRFRFLVVALVALLLVVTGCDSDEQLSVSAPPEVPVSLRFQTAADEAATDRYTAYLAGVMVELERRVQEEAREAAEAERAFQESQRSADDETATISEQPTYIEREGCTAGSPLPDHIIARESGGDCDAVNDSGACDGGRRCIGYAQVDEGHFWAVSPWNPNVAGSCYQLSYEECVWKLSDGGRNLTPWGG